MHHRAAFTHIVDERYMPRSNRRQPRSSQSRNGSGQSLVEFSLFLPALLLTMLVVVDFGHLFLGWVNLQNTARIGADYAATHPDAWDAGDPDLIEQARYEELIRRDATTINCTLPPSLPAPGFPDGSSTLNGRAQVSLTCDFQVLTPIISDIVGSPISLGATAIYPIRVGLYNVAVPATPPPTPTPTPSPTPTAALCTVPNLIGTRVNPATAAWKNAGFEPANMTVTIGANNYVIQTEDPPNSDGTLQDCTSFTILVGP